MIGQMRQTVFTDSNLQLFQDSLNDQFSQIGKIPFINGRLIEGQVLASGANVINHKLGRPAKGYFVTSKSANVGIWNDYPIASDTTITIQASGAVTIDLWVF